ncbi:alkyl/aryl-sulfatase [Spartinivicinus poritis]|uniref:MBL fold metallo-hydrolase n=1 Tax=Spartinivicinus poritis TaxID=2994640 RepID=A0ABT5U5A6_9GAMM|nr:alkyl sulfatase dimerization domain-containing protein [Spartinivicinus sp. A2-2]MDE1460737.1 MBL fold metallo-hydrolase [Spartinivicinus sp. A2-2]
MNTSRKDATQHTIDANQLMAEALNFSDTESFDNAYRGQMATWPNLTIASGDSGDHDRRIVWTLRPYINQTVGSSPPDTVNPSLWRQTRLNNITGLFEVMPGIYQLRGFDMSNMTIVEGPDGLIIIDPMISCECAQAGLQLYRENKPELAEAPVRAVIYTHSHIDHFGGVRGVVDESSYNNGDVKIVAPAGFLEHAASENIYAGMAMARRSMYMYGAYLEPDDKGHVDCGLGKAQSTGTVSLLPPTHTVHKNHQILELAGLKVEFHMTPGAEAPAEFDFYFPDLKAFCASENASMNMHNIQTLRGAMVRDALQWSKYLNEVLDMFGDADVMFASHHWPIWGNEKVKEFLSSQRDMYRYLNDQTLRMLNKGYTGAEIAEVFEMPPSLQQNWACRGYYGTVNHNTKAVYDRYLGWFDGNPSNLHALPPKESAEKYVALIGADILLEEATSAYNNGDYRWAAELLGKLVYAQPDNSDAKQMQADVFEQLGYQAEAGTWRNCYLMAALELREGIPPLNPGGGSADIIDAMTAPMVFDTLGVQLNGPRAEKQNLLIEWNFIDTKETFLMRVSNGALSYSDKQKVPLSEERVAATLTLEVLKNITNGVISVEEAISAGKVKVDGDEEILFLFFALLDEGSRDFPIVTPRPDASLAWTGAEPKDRRGDAKRRRQLIPPFVAGC